MWRVGALAVLCGVVMLTTAEGFEDSPTESEPAVRDSHTEPDIQRVRRFTPVEDDGARQAMDNLAPMIVAQERELHGPCGEWRDEALSVGWTAEEWKKLRWIIARETGNTCDPTVYNGNEATRDRSYGLLQINMRGKLEPDRLWRCGLSAKEELWDPVVNLRCGRVLFELAGWDPWRMR